MNRDNHDKQVLKALQSIAASLKVIAKKNHIDNGSCIGCKYESAFSARCDNCERKYIDRYFPKENTTSHKDVAKVPDLEGDGYDPDGNLVYDTWICPGCLARFKLEYQEHKHCPECGQKIDWRKAR